MDDDVQAVEVTEGTSSENQGKPLMRLFKRLIGNDNKQNTVLTNSQIVNILYREFQIETQNLHELEVDIYLNVMKKYLKKWPQWDEFDQIINNLKEKGEHDEITKILVLKYMDLKDYIQEKLNKVKPLTKKYLDEIMKKHVATEDEFLDVVMEICCTREQLNNLFFRSPQKDKIINTSLSTPSTISLETLEYKDMFFWWSIAIEIKANRSSVHWQTAHQLKHVLVNKKLNFPRIAVPLEQVIFATDMPSYKQRLYKMPQIETLLEEVLKQSYNTSYVPLYSVDLLIKIIKRDLEFLPSTLEGTSKYRRYLSKYPFVRYLYEPIAETVNSDIGKYDIQLEETFKPQSQLSLWIQDSLSSFKTCTISVKCITCEEEYKGHNMLESLRQHILSEHFTEPDWQCTNCKVTLSMVALAKGHSCR